MKRSISEIRVNGRCRQEAGDIDALAASIADVGLLHPVAIREDGQLVAGYRRLLAAKKLGWDSVPVTVVKSLNDAAALLRAERDENTCRLDFAPSEAVALGRALEAIERDAAKARQKTLNNAETASGNLPEAIGRTRDKVGAAVGMSGKTYEKARAVVEAAEAEPEKYGPVQARMDETRNVDAAFKAVKKINAVHTLPFEPQAFNVWSFAERNPAFGQEYPGNIPGDIIQNLLWLFTEPNAIVIDPFAGGGVTHDVCHWWNDKMWPVLCLSLDARPSRPEILAHDMTQGYPASAQNASLVVLDPPYWKQKRGDYAGGDNLADMPLEKFHAVIERIVEQSFAVLAPGGHVALLIGATRDGARYDHAAEMLARLRQHRLIDRIIVTYSTQQAAPYHVAAAKTGKLLLNRYRDLIVWQK